jgi:arylsulfatase A-like enzyme
MKMLIQLGVLAVALTFGLAANAHSPWYQPKPNVIIFMADDLGQDATRLYNPDDSELVAQRRAAGNPFPENAPMPALEELAQYGVTFKNAWAMPVCSVTRAARSTGLYASTTGVGQVIGQFTPRFGAPGPFQGVEFPPSMLHPDDPHSLQRLAKNAGYRTYKFGKWHEVDVDFTCQGDYAGEAPWENGGMCDFDPYDLTDDTAAFFATQGLNDTQRAGFDEFYGLLSGFFGGINGNGYGGGEVPFASQPTGAKLDDTVTDAIHMIDTRSTRVSPGGYADARTATCEFADSALVTRAITLIKEAEQAGEPYFIEFSALSPHFQYEVPPGPWDHAPAGCFDGEPGGWRTLDQHVHKEVIVQIIAAFNDLGALGLTVNDVRNNLHVHGPALYPKPGTRAPAGNDAASEAKRRAAFKGLVSYMDVQMYRLGEHVDWSNTYAIFVGDNGTQGGGAAFNVIEPPNDRAKSKATVYRNGREVPMVIAGPGWVQGVFDKRSQVNVTDLYATVLDLIWVEQPEHTKASSFSFAHALDGQRSERKVNVSEIFPSTAAVGGRNRIGSGAAGPFGTGARAVGNGRFSLLGFNRVDENNLFVCLPGSTALPEEDCYNAATGVYEHVVDLQFYDLRRDPFEMDALVFDEMSYWQHRAFRRLCKQFNEVSSSAVYYQNGYVCHMDGSNLRDMDPT